MGAIFMCAVIVLMEVVLVILDHTKYGKKIFGE